MITDTIAAVAAGLRNGLRSTEIAAELGLAPSTVRQYARRARAADLDAPKMGNGPRPWRRTEAARLANLGLDAAAIAERMDVTSDCVLRHLRAARERGEYDGALLPSGARIRISIPAEITRALRRQAALRGVGPGALARRILAAVLEPSGGSDLVDAVLDDMGGGDE